MASIQFNANVKPQVGNVGTAEVINHTAGSGLGFYGNGFRVSVPVGGTQEQTYVTDQFGTDQGVRLNNTAMASLGDPTEPNPTVGTVRINNGTAIDLNRLPNMSCPLNIRFTHGTPVRVQNCKLRIFNRNATIDDQATEVTTYVYEARHPSNDETVEQLFHRAYDTTNVWYEFTDEDAMTDMEMTASPGPSGSNSVGENLAQSELKGFLTNDGPLLAATQHDWYLALSSQPDTIGSKTDYALYFTLEYLE